MKVEQTNQSRNIASSRKTNTSTSSQGSNFASVLANALGSSDETSGVSSVSSINAVDSIFMVQAVGDATEGESRKKRSIDRGNAMLDALEDIRRELIFGEVSKERLLELAQMLRVRQEQGIPEKLDAIIKDIELRVEVELAKLTM